jgi:hypothetical protein
MAILEDVGCSVVAKKTVCVMIKKDVAQLKIMIDVL